MEWFGREEGEDSNVIKMQLSTTTTNLWANNIAFKKLKNIIFMQLDKNNSSTEVTRSHSYQKCSQHRCFQNSQSSVPVHMVIPVSVLSVPDYTAIPVKVLCLLVCLFRSASMPQISAWLFRSACVPVHMVIPILARSDQFFLLLFGPSLPSLLGKDPVRSWLWRSRFSQQVCPSLLWLILLLGILSFSIPFSLSLGHIPRGGHDPCRQQAVAMAVLRLRQLWTPHAPACAFQIMSPPTTDVLNELIQSKTNIKHSLRDEHNMKLTVCTNYSKHNILYALAGKDKSSGLRYMVFGIVKSGLTQPQSAVLTAYHSATALLFMQGVVVSLDQKPNLG